MLTLGIILVNSSYHYMGKLGFFYFLVGSFLSILFFPLLELLRLQSKVFFR